MLVIQSKKKQKKTGYKTKTRKTENKITTDQDYDKNITTQEFNKLTAEYFTRRLAKVNLASESIANL